MPGHTRAFYTPTPSSATLKSGTAAPQRYVTPVGSVSSSASKAVSFSDSVSAGVTAYYPTPAPSFHSVASDYPPTYHSGALSHASSYHSRTSGHHAGPDHSAHSGSTSSHSSRGHAASTADYGSHHSSSSSTPPPAFLAAHPVLSGAAPFSLASPPDYRQLPYHEQAFFPPVSKVCVQVLLKSGVKIKVDVVQPPSPNGLSVGDVVNTLVFALQSDVTNMLPPSSSQDVSWCPSRAERGIRVIDALRNGYVFTRLLPHPQKPATFVLETRAG
ncbi:uncharacterized protein SCHCODRAFT_02482328 [Schizophyllum commune H4-8]|nr:uncharacterized protein SCHCODRAFT_02482328 [Schizophyllum commune H4-8]KAI5899941.1 hypothetical protein SCHCODRAFT_02482328 [Schizophyllum commune H4-8]